MESWYLIEGERPDHVCLLNQRWGSFINNRSNEIEYPAVKTTLCEIDNTFLITPPIVTDLEDGTYR